MPPLMALPQSKMARLRLILLLLVLLCVAVYRYFLPFYWYCQYSPAEGDIIFQSLHSMDLVEAIEGITESPYSHVGLVVNKYGRWYVREAMVNVHDTPLEQWVRQGRWGQFAVY